MTPADIQNVILTIAHTLNVEVLDADTPLMDAGINSLGAIELRDALCNSMDAEMALPSTVVFEHPTVRQLAAALMPVGAATKAALHLRASTAVPDGGSGPVETAWWQGVSRSLAEGSR